MQAVVCQLRRFASMEQADVSWEVTCCFVTPCHCQHLKQNRFDLERLLTRNCPTNRTKTCHEAAGFRELMVPCFVCHEETAPSCGLAAAQLLPRATLDDGAPRTQSGTTLGRPWAQQKGCAQAASLRMSSWHSHSFKTSPNLHGRGKVESELLPSNTWIHTIIKRIGTLPIQCPCETTTTCATWCQE